MIDLFIKYLRHEKRYSEHTVIAYGKDLDQFKVFALEEFAIEDLSEVSHGIVRSWIITLSDGGIASSSINRKIATLKSFYKFLLVREFVKTNPTNNIKPLKTPKQLPSFVQEGNMGQLLDHFDFGDDIAGIRDKLTLELLYATGIRLSELTGLAVGDYNPYQNTLKVLGKRNKERVIPIPLSTVNTLKKYLSERSRLNPSCDSLLLTDQGEKLYPMWVYRKVKEHLQKVTTLSKKSPHVLRHTFATHLLNKGADLNAVKDLLGHASLAATQVYTHNSMEKLKSVFDQAHPKA